MNPFKRRDKNNQSNGKNCRWNGEDLEKNSGRFTRGDEKSRKRALPLNELLASVKLIK